MKLFFQITILLLLLASCAENSKKESTTKQQNKIESKPKIVKTKVDSILIPSFKVKLELTKNAEKKLTELKESIIVQAYFSGIPKDTTSEEYYKTGMQTIGSAAVELFDSRIAKFENLKKKLTKVWWIKISMY